MRVKPLLAVSRPVEVSVLLAVVAPPRVTRPVLVLKVPPLVLASKLPLLWMKPVMLLKAPALDKRWVVPVIRLPAVRVRSPAVMVAPPAVIVKPLPTVAAWLTLKPVPAPLKMASARKVLAPPMFWVPVEIRPGLVPSATSKFRVEPVMVAPLADAAPTVPTLLMPVPPVLVAIQAVPFQMKPTEVLAAILTPYIVKVALPLKELTWIMRPDVVTVGLGSVKVLPAVVWVTSKVVAPSTVFAAVVPAPPRSVEAPESLKALLVNSVLLALVKVLPVAIVTPVLKVPRPVTVTPAPNVVRPPLTVKALVPVTVVTPFK